MERQFSFLLGKGAIFRQHHFLLSVALKSFQEDKYRDEKHLVVCYCPQGCPIVDPDILLDDTFYGLCSLQPNGVG